MKLRLVLSWVMGPRVLKLKPKQLLYYIIEYYKKYDREGYLTKKYGEQSTLMIDNVKNILQEVHIYIFNNSRLYEKI